MRHLVPAVVLLLVVGACTDDDSATTSTSQPTTSSTVAPTTPTTGTSTPSSTSTTTLGEEIVTGEPLPIVGATVSREIDGFPAGDAIDGDIHTWWGAGAHAPQWIRLDFGAEVTITALELVVSQDPPGEATHELVGDGETLLTITRATADLDVITVVPDEPWTGVSVLEIRTVSSPSWVSWREVAVFGETTEGPPVVAAPDVVFTGGPILTMTEAGTVEALAVTGETITAAGDADEILATAGAATRIIDLGGRALMPGFVDPHTHILNDAWRIELDTLGGQQLALENGITTLANLFTTPEFLDEMLGYEEAGELRARISLYLIATDNCGEPQGDWWMEHPPTRQPGERLRIGGIKLFLDGGTCGPWAVSEETIVGVEPGPVFLAPEEVEAIYGAANAMGYQTVTHAVGDVAITAALDAHAATMEPGNPLRHRIDHVTMVTDAVIDGFQATRMDAAVFGFYPTCPGGFEASEFAMEHMRRHQPLIAANPDSVIAWHGDDPWVGPINPLQELHNMVTRVEIRDDGTVCAPEPWLAEKTFAVDQALEMMTIDAAYLLRRETEVGSLEAGKYADLVVLSADPTAVPERDIFDIEILLTMVGGTVEVCNEPSLCP